MSVAVVLTLLGHFTGYSSAYSPSVSYSEIITSVWETVNNSTEVLCGKLYRGCLTFLRRGDRLLAKITTPRHIKNTVDMPLSNSQAPSQLLPTKNTKLFKKGFIKRFLG